jgi:hypothetical protein
VTQREQDKAIRDACDEREGRVKSKVNTNALREKNRKKRKRAEQSAIWKIDHPTSVRGHVMKWRRNFREKYNEYMRGYRRRRNELQLV